MMQSLKVAYSEAQLVWLDEHKKPQIIPLKHMHISGKILDISSELTLEYLFQNNQASSIEAVFCFPIEAASAVTGFTIETEDKIITGEINERDKAFEKYDDAMANGNTAFLLDRESDDILYLSVGNLAPGQNVNIRVAAVKELECRDNIIRVILPLTISPRYAPAGINPLAVDHLSHNVVHKVPWKASMNIRVLNQGINKITSSSHQINIEKQKEFFQLSFAEEEIQPDRDIFIDLHAEESDGQCLISRHENGDSAALIRFNPSLPDMQLIDEKSLELYFLLDCSGSMIGRSIESAKETIELCLRQLSENDLYNIYCFGSSYMRLSRQLFPNNTANFNKAMEFIRNQDANMGGTELLDPLKKISETPTDPNRQKIILLITDGQVMNEKQILNLFKENDQNIRVFTFAIGYGAAHGLLKDLAEITGAAYEAIHPKEHSAPIVLRQFSRMTQAKIHDLKIRFDSGDSPAFSISDNLFEGDVWSKFLDLSSGNMPQKAVVMGKYLNEPTEWVLPVHNLGMNNLIPTLHANKKIKFKLLKAPNVSKQKNRYHNYLLKLALKYSLLTDLTSFVGVQQRKENNKLKENPEYVRVPIQLSYTWGGSEIELKEPVSLKDNSPVVIMRDTSMEVRAYHRISPIENETYFSNFSEDKKNVLLLSLQELDGSFGNIDEILKALNLNKTNLEKLNTLLPGSDSNLQSRIIATFLFLRYANLNPEFAKYADRAIKRAEKWLKDQCEQLKFEYVILKKAIVFEDL